MRLWADSTEETPVRWFRAHPNAEDIPHLHAFGSENWSFGPRDSVVGEVEGAARPWYNGADEVGYQGTHFCGGQEAWEGGGVHDRDPVIETDEQGYADCCGPPIMRGRAALKITPRGIQAGHAPAFDPVEIAHLLTICSRTSTHFSTSLTVTPAVGDVVLWIMMLNVSSSAVTGKPTGWTLQADYKYTSAARISVAYKIWAAGDATTISWAHNNAGQCYLFWAVVRGTPPAVPVQAGLNHATGTSALIAPSITLAHPSAINYLIFACANQLPSGTPAGYTEVGTTGNVTPFTRALRKDPAPAGATGNQQTTIGTAFLGCGVQVGVY